jgi:leucyl aminopeptidase
VEIKVGISEITRSKSDIIILPFFEDQKLSVWPLSIINEALGGLLSRLIDKGEIQGKYKEITQIFTLGKIESPKIMLVGMGKAPEIDLQKIRVCAAEVCKTIQNLKVDQVDFVVWKISNQRKTDFDIAQSIVEGAILGSYRFNKHKYKDNQSESEIGIFNIIVDNESKLDIFRRGCEKGLITANAALLVRDMVNEPANYMTPAIMADMASQTAISCGLKIDIFGYEDIKSFGMGGLLGVSRGSLEPPKLITLEYKGNSSSNLDLALVGKGITFDSGGISIKPSENMSEMKGDMAGGAAVIGIMGAVAQFKPNINILGIIPATENMPGGSAMRPGDIIKIMNGKTVEIISTDAEGRLILADGICYAQKMGAKRIVDIATLTGGCRIALGDICVGAFGNNQTLINNLIAAGSQAGECIWQMPMNEEYRELNKSTIADLKNSGGRYASAISAAWFLGEFAAGSDWVHLDIAGTSMAEKDSGYLIKGATGVPVRTIINFILSLSAEQ